jgi:hypothetical protein
MNSSLSRALGLDRGLLLHVEALSSVCMVAGACVSVHCIA